MMTTSDREEVVKQSLAEFMKKHISNAELSMIDEIVLSYVVSILEDLGESESTEEVFDVESFSEMMSAFFPEFSDIAHDTVCEWMFQLSDQLRKEHISENTSLDMGIAIPFPSSLSSSGISLRSRSQSEGSSGIYTPPKKRTPNLSESSDCGSDRFKCNGVLADLDEDVESQIKLLQEMFPTVCSLEVAHCVSVSGGNLESAAQLVLHRQESGEDIKNGSSGYSVSTKTVKEKQDDKSVKDAIIARYSYVGEDEDTREHKPPPPKWEGKKLVRYRDNKIVSLKGERYTEVKSEEKEDMKKTYVNLKPARQYRFH